MRSQFHRIHPAKSRWAGVAVLATGALLLSGCAADATPAAGAAAVDCDTVTKSSLLLATSDLDISYTPYGLLAKQLGYFDDECIDMTVDVTASGSVQSLLAGKTDFAMTGPEQLVTANKGAEMGAKTVYNLIPNLNIYLGVLDDSTVKTTADLAGGTIGLESDSPMYDAFLDRTLTPDGISMDSMKTIVTAYGVTPAEALKSGDVDAVLYWPGMFTSWEAAGYDMRILPGTEWSGDFDGIGLSARDDTIKDDPKLVEGVSRAIAKAMVYAIRYPESVVEKFWAAYPERAPLPGADEDAALERDLAVLKSTLKTMGAEDHDVDYAWGTQTEERWTNQVAYMQTAGIVDASATIDPTLFFDASQIEAANDFDHDLITEQK
jgi:NitT/TauT family transport system substrate-binding protein